MKQRDLTLVAGAVYDEISMFLKHLGPRNKEIIGGYPLVTGVIFDKEVAVLTTGPGPVHMAAALGWALPNLKPSCLILTGCGGGFEEAGLRKGDLALATEEINPQLGIEAPSGNGPVIPLPFLSNRFPLDKTLAQKAGGAVKNSGRLEDVRVYFGPFLTVATVTSTKTRSARYHRDYSAVVENMEGFSAVAICRIHQVPVIEIRAVSNHVGDYDRGEWELGLAFERSQQAALSIIEEGAAP
ncbi:MAG: futalosine hydrolase [Thermodesulfobacteriota bacterium]|nr:futalosine hydrolase [Thermodesulfobacteriota bacterium]